MPKISYSNKTKLELAYEGPEHQFLAILQKMAWQSTESLWSTIYLNDLVSYYYLMFPKVESVLKKTKKTKFVTEIAIKQKRDAASL